MKESSELGYHAFILWEFVTKLVYFALLTPTFNAFINYFRAVTA